ncbi:MAG: hypothetical protein GY828_00880 [Candidatus Gracilibacteria bacterium]|nr:hypothetical protein [Candidatus Gracilibacteria bacterium]
MKKVLLCYFGNFLCYDFNSSKIFVEESIESERIDKVELGVFYHKGNILREITKKKYDKIVIFGMRGDIKKPSFEQYAKNEMKHIRNPIYRFICNIYLYYLNIRKVNFTSKKQISEKFFKIFQIEKSKEKIIKLRSECPVISGLDISQDAGNYVCNYTMWVVEKFLKKYQKDTEFYFIHLPYSIKSQDKKKLQQFIED